MDELPPSLVVEILSRLTDSADVARCRVASKTMNSLACEVRSLNLVCTLSRYLKSRSPETGTLSTPFKTIVRNLIAESRKLESVSIGVQRSLGGMAYDDVEDESDDLFLNDVGFVSAWLPRICRDLRFLSISDFWIQSCWRRSDVLALISSSCHNLVQLELKNAWLSVDGLTRMPNLKNLTLEFIRLDDEDLNKVNDCFPYLEVLNLVGVGGLKEPKIHLLHLKSCQWTVSNAPHSLAIFSPSLVKLRLKCIKPKSLVLETPMLSVFRLSLEEAKDCRMSVIHDLKILELESSDTLSLIRMFPFGNTVKKLTVDSLKPVESVQRTKLGLGSLLEMFPNTISLNLGPGIWSEMESCFHIEGRGNMSRTNLIKEITARLAIRDLDVTISFIGYVLDQCKNLKDVGLLIHCEVDPSISSKLISRCSMSHPRVRWRWGMWKAGTEDSWVSD